ncbi:MAG TPA: sigma-70 family RNA polymerase sigma factor [Sphingobacteriaceae bacterium]
MKFIKNKAHGATLNEQQLLAEYRRTGDLETLGLLYEQYMPLVYGLCLKYFKDDEKSKDAVMQIFEQLITKLRIHEVSNFKSWLYTLARNYCLMQLRVSGRHNFEEIQENIMENAPLVHLDIDEVRETQLVAMEECMQHLPREQKISVDLFYLQQKSYKEISEITGYDINKVKSYIQNGKRNLKICIEKRSEK